MASKLRGLGFFFKGEWSRALWISLWIHAWIIAYHLQTERPYWEPVDLSTMAISASWHLSQKPPLKQIPCDCEEEIEVETLSSASDLVQLSKQSSKTLKPIHRKKRIKKHQRSALFKSSKSKAQVFDKGNDGVSWNFKEGREILNSLGIVGQHSAKKPLSTVSVPSNEGQKTFQQALRSYERGIYKRIFAQRNYPKQALRRRIQGKVLLQVKIDAQGHLLDVKILKSSGYTVLDRAAVQLIRKLDPYAAPPLGIKLPLILKIPIHYRIQNR